MAPVELCDLMPSSVLIQSDIGIHGIFRDLEIFLVVENVHDGLTPPCGGASGSSK